MKQMKRTEGMGENGMKKYKQKDPKKNTKNPSLDHSVSIDMNISKVNITSCKLYLALGSHFCQIIPQISLD